MLEIEFRCEKGTSMASHLNNSIASIWGLCLFSCRTGRVNKQTVDGATLNGAKHGVRQYAEWVDKGMGKGWTNVSVESSRNTFATIRCRTKDTRLHPFDTKYVMTMGLHGRCSDNNTNLMPSELIRRETKRKSTTRFQSLLLLLHAPPPPHSLSAAPPKHYHYIVGESEKSKTKHLLRRAQIFKAKAHSTMQPFAIQRRRIVQTKHT